MWIFSKTKEVLGFRSPESVILSEVLSCPVRAFFYFVVCNSRISFVRRK